MLPSLVSIYLELGAGIVLVWPGLRAFWMERGNRIRRYFLLATLLLAAGFLIDGTGRWLLYQQSAFTDAYFRFAELCFLPAGVCLVYLGGIFPRRVRRWDWRSGRRSRLLLLLGGLTLVSAALGALAVSNWGYVSGRLYLPVPGTYYGVYGFAYYLNRLFLPVCLLIAAFEQRRFLQFHERDPRRVHARYFIMALLVLTVTYAGLMVLLLFSGGFENEFMAATSVACLLFSFFLHNMLENLSVSYRANLLRNAVLLFIYGITLVPLFYAIDLLLRAMGPEQSLFTALLLCALFVIFYLTGRVLRPRISRLLFKEQARIEDNIARFNQSILRLGPDETVDVSRRLVDFLDEVFAPRLIALYFPEGGAREEELPELSSPDAGLDSDADLPAQAFALQRATTRTADLESIPPARFDPQLMAFLAQASGPEALEALEASASPPAPIEAGAASKTEDAVDARGGLLADLLVRAELSGDESTIEVLMELADAGAEMILPFYDGASKSPDFETDAGGMHSGNSETPEAILVVGLLSSGRPIDHNDMHLLWLLQTPILLALKNQALLRDATALKEKLEEENKRITRRLNQSLSGLSDRQGEHPDAGPRFVFQPGGPMASLLNQSEIFANQSSPVLITGETGTGKGEIARMMHGLSGRTGRFVTVNLSAIPADLIENELFGHTKGAYTGASDAQAGLVDRAAEGTLFLDEIGELSAAGQTKLLRLVQHGEYEAIGSSETKYSTARFLFATNKDLEAEVQAGAFRSDLYFRISTFELPLPPLRERRQDLPLLIDHFLEAARHNFHRPGLELSAGARRHLLRYAWPGNVRELENLLFRTVVLADSDVLEEAHLPVMFRDELDFNRKKQQLERMAGEQSRLEKELLLEAMQKSGGNQRAAAKILNISRGSLQYRLKQHGLN